VSNKFLIGVIGVTVLVLVVGVVAAVKWPASSASLTGGGKLQLAEKTYDWGDIPINGGKVEKAFEITNSGEGVLELANFATSCMCTTAVVEMAEGASPAFGMHEKSAWKGRLEPGDTAVVKVVFDPAYHGPGGKGVVTRVVSFETSDPDNKKVELWLKGKVI
jgi:hypothetical protein